jgi:NADPH-dependent 7-cyano-7-deazaguanine reductase QueF-like protein
MNKEQVTINLDQIKKGYDSVIETRDFILDVLDDLVINTNVAVTMAYLHSVLMAVEDIVDHFDKITSRQLDCKGCDRYGVCEIQNLNKDGKGLL